VRRDIEEGKAVTKGLYIDKYGKCEASIERNS
jgi:hypothetical protein